MESNIFLDPDSFAKLHNAAFRKQRLSDFDAIYNITKNHLKPKNKIAINKKQKEKYIATHQPENQDLITKLFGLLEYISFDKFFNELQKSFEAFQNNIGNKNYVVVFGATDNVGSSKIDIDIFKSNFWCILLLWKSIKKKPFDIVPNLNSALMIYPDINDFVIFDDCTYSGTQINNVITEAAIELSYRNSESYKKLQYFDKTLFRPISVKPANIHLVIPFMSFNSIHAFTNKILMTGFNFFLYQRYVANNLSMLLENADIAKITNLYKTFYPGINYFNINNLVPVYFQHKIADMYSTFELILIKGQVLDNPKEKINLISLCAYNKNKKNTELYNPEHPMFITSKIDCPIPPYKKLKKILLKK